MELERNNYEKCLEILPASSPVDDDRAIPSYSYSEAEMQHLTILSIFDIENEYDGMARFSNIHSGLKGQVNKRPREECMENAAKGLYELSSLRDLAKMAIKTDQQLIQPYFRKNDTLKTSVFIPLVQKMTIISSRFASSRILLKEAVSMSEKSIQNHAIIIQKLRILGKYWKLLTPGVDLAGRGSSATSSKEIVLYVDCSLVSLGDHPSTSVDYLVPLSIEENRLVVPRSVLLRHVSTLEFQLLHRELGLIAQITAWDIHVANQDGRLLSKDLDDDLEIINSFCSKRHHDALSSRLFGRLRYNALDFKSNWILKDHRDNYPRVINYDLLIEALQHECLMSVVELWSLDRGSLQVALSDKLSIRISLVPINEDACKSHSADLPFDSCIIQAYKLAQSYLFYHFSQSLLDLSAPSVSSIPTSKTAQSANSDLQAISVMGRSKAVSFQDLSKIKVVSALEALLHSLKANIWKILLESFSVRGLRLQLMKSTHSTATAEVLSRLPSRQDDTSHDFALEIFDYDVQDGNTNHSEEKRISLRITSSGYDLKVLTMTESSVSSSSLRREFTSANDLLDFLQSSMRI